MTCNKNLELNTTYISKIFSDRPNASFFDNWTENFNFDENLKKQSHKKKQEQ